MNWYLEVWKKYAVFSGRARRKEYWMFVLINIIVALLLAGAAAVAKPLAILYLLYSLAVTIPGLAVSVRRLHDTGHSGWWLLICFLPLVGAIALLVFMVLDSEAGDNEYGPNPKTT